MQKNYKQRLYMLTKFTLYGFILQTFLFTFLFASEGSSQNAENVNKVKVVLRIKNASIKDAFSIIENNTHYRFAFDKKDIDPNITISVDESEYSVADILRQISQKTNLGFRQINNTIYVKKRPKAAQLNDSVEVVIQVSFNLHEKVQLLKDINIKGRIISQEDNQPIPGVNVIVKGTSIGTTTNLNGDYSINVPDQNSILVFSFIGYNTEEVAISGRSVVDVSLIADIKQLSEVVVVGYGTQKKVNLTGAVSTVDSKTIENRPVTNAVSALQGTATGLVVTRNNGQPGNEQFNIQVRGLSSVNGGRPLIWVDGAPGSLDNLNPNDIESINILKDAAATAIYGARAAGGVIVVTTKKGKQGKITVDYSGLFGVQRAINVPGRLNSWEEAELANLSRANAGQQAPYTAEEIEWMKSDDVDYIVDPTNQNRYRYYYNFDRQGMALRETMPSQTHNISLRGGDEKSTFFASLGYFNQEGIFKVGNDNTNRYNARLNYSRQLSKIVNLETRLGYNQRNVDAPSGNANQDYGIMMRLYTSRRLQPIYLPETNDTQYAAGLDEAYARLKDGGRALTRGDELNAVVTLKITEPVKGLTLRGVYSPQYITEKREIFNRTVPRYERFNRVADVINQQNSYERNRRATFTNSLQFLADYDLKLGDKHNFHVLGGYSFEDYRMEFMGATGRSLVSNDIPSLTLGIPTQSLISDDVQTWALLSYFGRFNYNFDEKYLFEANLRYDGSSKLTPTNRWQAFPSLSAAWRVNNENFFSGLTNVISELKIRGSWGQVGNSDGVIGNYDYLPVLQRNVQWWGEIFYYPFNQNQVTNSLYQRVLASPQKTWETIETTNVGLDMGFFTQKLTLSADYFIKRNKDMLAPLQVPATIGIETSTYNVAEMKTWGYEIALGWRDELSPSFSYYVNANFSDFQNEITDYNGQIGVQPGRNQIVEGRPYNSIFGYIADGYFQTADEVAAHAFQNSRTGAGDLKFKDINGDNVINNGNSRDGESGDLVYLGNMQPRLIYGFDFGFNFKGFDFSAFFQGVGKRNILLQSEQIVPFVETWRMPWDINLDYWTPENPDARFPRLFVNDRHNTVHSSHWVMNAAYMRLKNLQVGYTLPQELTRRAKIERARIFFSGQDLWEVSKMWNKYYDPESPNEASYHYPFFRTYSAGVNLTF